MNEQHKAWLEIAANLIKWFVLTVLVLGWNATIISMLIQGRLDEISALVWAIYGAVMSAFGIPVAYQGVKTLKKGQ